MSQRANRIIKKLVAIPVLALAVWATSATPASACGFFECESVCNNGYSWDVYNCANSGLEGQELQDCYDQASARYWDCATECYNHPCV